MVKRVHRVTANVASWNVALAGLAAISHIRFTMTHHAKDSRSLWLIVHGERAGQPELREAVERAREAGHRIEPRVTWEAGDAERYTREAIAAAADTVIAAGGDGTVNEVLNGMAAPGHHTALGILPLGTANDFAVQAGIPNDALAAMDLILSQKARRMDTGEMNGRRFLNVSTGGIGAETTAETSSEAKEALGKLAYAITGLRKFAALEPRRARIVAPGLDADVEFLLFAVGNTRATGGGIRLTPRALTRDGLLDLCIVPSMPRAEFARVTLRCRTGEHLEEEGVIYLQVPWVRIEGEESLRVNLDGEPCDASHLGYRARSGDLLIHVAHLPEEGDQSELAAASVTDAGNGANVTIDSGAAPSVTDAAAEERVDDPGEVPLSEQPIENPAPVPVEGVPRVARGRER